MMMMICVRFGWSARNLHPNYARAPSSSTSSSSSSSWSVGELHESGRLPGSKHSRDSAAQLAATATAAATTTRPNSSDRTKSILFFRARSDIRPRQVARGGRRSAIDTEAYHRRDWPAKHPSLALANSACSPSAALVGLSVIRPRSSVSWR